MTNTMIELFRLIEENPELPVVPMVDSEIVSDDDYSRWIGAFGTSYIDEYIIGEDKVHFRDNDDFEEIANTLTDGQITYEEFENSSNEVACAIYDSLPWVKAIIVNIDLPD